jgi:hypothetical protein
LAVPAESKPDSRVTSKPSMCMYWRSAATSAVSVELVNDRRSKITMFTTDS